jgi:hypothetical protein
VHAPGRHVSSVVLDEDDQFFFRLVSRQSGDTLKLFLMTSLVALQILFLFGAFLFPGILGLCELLFLTPNPLISLVEILGFFVNRFFLLFDSALDPFALRSALIQLPIEFAT